ncbi:hypothetical protein BC629DRAFT_620115 [Irpex lacteus]|nr:hypothetical protein BC629DRAFT_620115 [Irpex lacteus]
MCSPQLIAVPLVGLHSCQNISPSPQNMAAFHICPLRMTVTTFPRQLSTKIMVLNVFVCSYERITSSNDGGFTPMVVYTCTPSSCPLPVLQRCRRARDTHDWWIPFRTVIPNSVFQGIQRTNMWMMLLSSKSTIDRWPQRLQCAFSHKSRDVPHDSLFSRRQAGKRAESLNRYVSSPHIDCPCSAGRTMIANEEQRSPPCSTRAHSNLLDWYSRTH